MSLPPSPPPAAGRRSPWVRAGAAERLFASLLLALVAAAGAWLLTHDPTASPAVPRCPTYAWTGILCPGCGALRALHALLGGNLSAALAFNPLVVLTAPFGVVWLALQAACAVTGLRPRLPARAVAVAGLVAVVVLLAFAVARNLPVTWCDPLRPPPDRIGATARSVR